MFWDVFCQLCQKQGVSPTQAILQMGISRASVTKWKNGALPSAESLIKLSEYFGVSIDYLCGKSVPAEANGRKLTADEEKLLSLFEMLSEVDRLRLIIDLQDKTGGKNQ